MKANPQLIALLKLKALFAPKRDPYAKAAARAKINATLAPAYRIAQAQAHEHGGHPGQEQRDTEQPSAFAKDLHDPNNP